MHKGRLYYLGRYACEDDALAVYRKYTEEIAASGDFSPKKIKKSSGTVAELYSELEYDISEVPLDPKVYLFNLYYQLFFNYNYNIFSLNFIIMFSS